MDECRDDSGTMTTNRVILDLVEGVEGATNAIGSKIQMFFAKSFSELPQPFWGLSPPKRRENNFTHRAFLHIGRGTLNENPSEIEAVDEQTGMRLGCFIVELTHRFCVYGLATLILNDQTETVAFLDLRCATLRNLTELTRGVKQVQGSVNIGVYG